MTMQLFAWALHQYEIPSDEKFVLMAMSEAASDADNVWHGSIDGICRFTNLSQEEVLEITERLFERGLLVRAGLDIQIAAPVLEVERSPDPAHWFKKKQISKATRLLVLHRDNHQCKQCGTEEDLTIDHIHPESKGGSNQPDNLQVLCRKCNCSKGAKVQA